MRVFVVTGAMALLMAACASPPVSDPAVLALDGNFAGPVVADRYVPTSAAYEGRVREPGLSVEFEAGTGCTGHACGRRPCLSPDHDREERLGRDGALSGLAELPGGIARAKLFDAAIGLRESSHETLVAAAGPRRKWPGTRAPCARASPDFHRLRRARCVGRPPADPSPRSAGPFRRLRRHSGSTLQRRARGRGRGDRAPAGPISWAAGAAAASATRPSRSATSGA